MTGHAIGISPGLPEKRPFSTLSGHQLTSTHSSETATPGREGHGYLSVIKFEVDGDALHRADCLATRVERWS